MNFFINLSLLIYEPSPTLSSKHIVGLNLSDWRDLILASLTKIVDAHTFQRSVEIVISSYPGNESIHVRRRARMLLLAPIGPYALIEVSTD